MKYFFLIKKYFLTSEFINFFFLGISLLFTFCLFVFLPEIIVFPFIKPALILLLTIFYIVNGLSFLNLLEQVKKLDIEKIQINAIIRSISDPVISYSKDFEIILVNSAFEDLVKIPREKLIGKIIRPEMVNDPTFGFLTKLIFPSLAPIVLERSTAGYPQRIKIQFLEPKEYIFEIVTSKVMDENGKVFGFLKIIHDLTREEELKKTQTDFITVAAHQLRTPLAGLSWILEMLYKQEVGSLNNDQLKLLEDARLALQESLSTVEGLLQAAQIESGKLGFQFERTNLIKLIEEAIKKYEPLAKKENIKIILYPPPSLGEIVIDPFRIKLVLEILLDNAIKYNVKNGEVRIKIEVLKNQPFVAISVEDTGIGIPESDLPKIFQKFFRSSSALKEKTSGLGLGLYLAKNIIERHGGKIWVKSVYQRGSIFTFVLPLDPSLIPKY
ncbi:MAG: ATP-binding protein [Candidatus Paceibacterota bacterium]